MKFVDNIRNALNPYSDQIIREYVKQINAEMETQEGIQKHPWMRENLLTSDLYSCIINGERVSLNEILFGTKSANTRQNIIVITGEKHIGKQYFVKKLLNVCKKTVDDENKNLEKAAGESLYRIPVVVEYGWYQEFGKDLKLDEMIAKIIEEKGSLTINYQKRAFLRQSIDKLLKDGRFFIFFKGKCWLREMEDGLKKILVGGKIVEEYNERRKYSNLVILTVDSEADIRESFLNENNHVMIRLNRLSVEEVMSYLKQYLPALLELVQENENIIEMLRFPEHLKMFETLYTEKLIEEDNHEQLNNTFDFYDYFIRANINKKLKTVDHGTGHIANIGRENAIWKALQKYAVGLYLEKKKVITNPSQHFSFADFREVGLLDESDNFVFPLCGYYLVARHLVEELKNKKIKTIQECLLEEPLEIILFWTVNMMGDDIETFDIETFSELWKILCSNDRCKLLLLAKIVKETPTPEAYMDGIYEKAFLNLKREFYDYTVLETFKELGEGGVIYLKKKYLELDDYENIPRNNIKKRSVYFLGISHSGIIGKMLTELMQEDTDLHLKYHIIRAAVENYNEHDESTELIKRKFDELTNYCGTSDDPIIKSDFCVLYKKSMGNEWMAPQDSHKLAEELKEKMNDSIYWVRAHAAGAIGRRNDSSSYKLLLEQVDKELQLIYMEGEGYRNSIKVISYSVEALCEMSEHRKNKTREIIYQLVDYLDMDRLGNQDIEDAYSTIATGIEYMINADTEKLPFNLGGRFRNHTINYQKVLLNVFSELNFFFENDEEELNKINRKREELEKVMARAEYSETDQKESVEKLRILQLTDWHFKGSSSDNNLLIRAIKKKVKDIDMLVITGDLKQNGQEYDNTLSILGELVGNLGLEKQDVFMVPGNHDCEDYTGKEKIFEEIRNEIFNNKECYQKYLAQLYQGLQGYEKFLEQFYGEEFISQGGLHNGLHLWKNRLYILNMNTALLCDRNSHKEKLVDIEELSRIDKNDNVPVIGIAHHKLSQIYMDHRDTIKAVFNELNVSALLSGDIHRSEVEGISLGSRTIPNYVCGKFLGDASDVWSNRNIAIYELDFGTRQITPFFYKWERSQLIPDYTTMESLDGLEKWKRVSVELV